MSDVKIGDVVVRRGAQQRMTIENIVKSFDEKREMRVEVVLVWFDQDDVLHRASCDAKHLEVVES